MPSFHSAIKRTQLAWPQHEPRQPSLGSSSAGVTRTGSVPAPACPPGGTPSLMTSAGHHPQPTPLALAFHSPATAPSPAFLPPASPPASSHPCPFPRANRGCSPATPLQPTPRSGSPELQSISLLSAHPGNVSSRPLPSCSVPARMHLRGPADARTHTQPRVQKAPPRAEAGADRARHLLLTPASRVKELGKTTGACKPRQLNNIIPGDRHAQARAPSPRVFINQVLN